MTSWDSFLGVPQCHRPWSSPYWFNWKHNLISKPECRVGMQVPEQPLWGPRAFLLRTPILVIPLMLMLRDKRGQKVGMERSSAPLGESQASCLTHQISRGVRPRLG